MINKSQSWYSQDISKGERKKLSSSRPRVKWNFLQMANILIKYTLAVERLKILLKCLKWNGNGHIVSDYFYSGFSIMRLLNNIL